MPFGDLLRRYRLASGLTQEALAERAGVSIRGIQYLERGEGKPQRGTLRRLANALELTPERYVRLEAAALPAPRLRAVANDYHGPAIARRGVAPELTMLSSPATGGFHDNLPAQPNVLIDRESDVAAVRALLSRADVRLVTLTGPGGVGKTRLALAVAADLAESFPNGACLVSLAAVRDPRHVVPAIATALDLREPSSRALAQRLRDYLRHCALLLVLDNFEQVHGAGSALWDLLSAAAGVKALVTSRAALRLRAEHRYPVAPLDFPDSGHLASPAQVATSAAVQLFVQRARAVQPDFALNGANAAAVAEVCRRLDGLPLAIELAAARIRLLDPAALLARLDQRFSMLTGGGDDLPPRQRTLHATLSWSYDLLTPDQRTLIRRLAVFVDGATWDAASAVLAPLGRRSGQSRETPRSATRLDQPDLRGAVRPALPGPAADLVDDMEALVEQNLVLERESPGGERRLGMQETVRAFAWDRLIGTEEAAAVRRSHASYYLALAEEAGRASDGPELVAWLDRLELELGNLRAALTWWLDDDAAKGARMAGRLVRLWQLHGHHAEGRRWQERLLAVVPPGASARARLELDTATLALTNGDYAGARGPVVSSHAWFQERGDRWGVAWTTLHLATLLQHDGDYAQAQSRLEQSLALFRELGDRRGSALALGGLANLARIAGDDERARARYEESLALLRGLGDSWALTQTLNSLGTLARSSAAYERAAALFEESLARCREMRYPGGVRKALGELGNIHRIRGHYPRARACLEEALTIAEEEGIAGSVGRILHHLGNLAASEGDASHALTLYEASVTHYREAGDTLSVGVALGDLGNLARTRDELGLAATRWREGLAIVERFAGYRWLVAWSLSNVATLTARQGAHERAARLVGAAERVLPELRLAIDPDERDDFAAALASARAALGEARFLAARSQGQAMPSDRAIAYALEGPADPC